MSDLIHCNICFKMPNPRVKFFVNNCGHMACQWCVQAGKMKPKCHLCNQKTQMRLIAPGMKGFDMFESPLKAIDDLIEKAERSDVRTRQSTPYPRDEQDSDKQFRCDTCAQSFDKKCSLIEHKNEAHCGGSNNESGESTEVCDQDWSSAVTQELMDGMSQLDQEFSQQSEDTGSQVGVKRSKLDQLNEDESQVVELFFDENSQLQPVEAKEDSQDEQVE